MQLLQPPYNPSQSLLFSWLRRGEEKLRKREPFLKGIPVQTTLIIMLWTEVT